MSDSKTSDSDSAASSKSSPSVEVACPRCEETRVVAAGDSGRPWICPVCDWRPAEPREVPKSGQPVESCWVCGGERFYLQKDFHRQVGLAIVYLSAGLVFLIMMWKGHLVGIGLLLAVALIDWIAYRLIGTVTVCYLCHSIYRGFPPAETHTGFSLEVEEEHKKLRRRFADEQGAAEQASTGAG